MLRGCVLGLAVVAACSSDHGLYLVITSPQKLSKVELFFGDQPNSTCSANGCTVEPFRGSGSAVPYAADAYSQSLTTATWMKLEGDSLTYRVEPGDNPHTASAILVVGYNDQDLPVVDKVMYNVEIKSTALEVDVPLDPVDSLTGDPESERIEVWRRPTDTDSEWSQSACALVRHPDSSRRDNDYFGPIDDADCDGALPKPMPPPECSSNTELEWCGQTPSGLSEANCIKPVETGACRVAGPPCVDGGTIMMPSTICPAPTAAEMCTPSSPIGCMPSELCHNTSGSGGLPCNTLDASCISSQLQSGGTQKITCPMYTGNTFCTVHLDAASTGIAPFLGTRTCKMLQIAAIATPFRPFSTTVAVPNGSYTLTPTGTCAGDLMYVTSAATMLPPAIFAVFVVDDNFTPEYIVVPLSPETTGGCPTLPVACSADNPTAVTCP